MPRTDSSTTPLALAGRLLMDSEESMLRDSIADTVTRLEHLEYARRFVPYVLAQGVLPDIGEETAIDSVGYAIANRLDGAWNLKKLTEEKNHADDLPPAEAVTKLSELTLMNPPAASVIFVNHLQRSGVNGLRPNRQPRGTRRAWITD